ncbi:MAG: NAD-dependent dehydratase [Planctomycetes bacterium RBG_16_59_8]|nr:MAG: NAD-dependent dehydratase [Planctomycetes bacterium RBG_16_59_8]
MRTVITGGAGFIGSHLCDYFLQRGETVVCIDNFLTGSRRNIRHLRRNRKFTLIEHDVTKYIDVPGRVDNVLHFASPASPLDYAVFKIQTLKVGAMGTHNALGLAVKKKARFLLASTSEIYGDPLEHPQRESYWGNVNPIGPRGVYDEAKRYAEALTMAYHRCHGLNTKIARIFNTYGPRMRVNDGRALPTFIAQALRDEKITVFGKGSQTRSFCYVTDLIDGLARLLRSRENYPVNIGNPVEHTIAELATMIVDLAGSGNAVIHKPLPEDDPKVRRPDIARARTILGWRPTIPLPEGLRKTIDYFRTIVPVSKKRKTS